MDWARILAYVTGTVDQELLGRNEYLAAENRIMKAQLKGDRSVRTTSEARPQDSARPRDRWIPVPFPPPLPRRQLSLASMECPKSFCIQRGLAKSTKPRRLQTGRFSVSEGVLSLSDRTSHKLVWIQKT